MRTRAARLSSSDVKRLRAIRAEFTGHAASLKRAILLELSKRSLDRPRILREYHDVLLFIAAHPENAKIERAVDAELRRIGRAVARLPRRHRDALADSGVAGSAVETGFSIDLVLQLVRRFGAAIEIAWDKNGSAGKVLDEALQWCAGALESVGLLSDELTTQEWMEWSGLRGSKAIGWIIRHLKSRCSSSALREQVFDHLDLPLRWRLAADGPSRTLIRLPIWTPAYRTLPLKRSIPFNRMMREPLQALSPLPMKDARRMITAAQNALAVRGRETDPLTAANEREVYHVPTGHGFDVNLFGIKPANRLPLESFIGYVAARHAVPIAYGGAWIFYNQAEIGINIFDEFRGGESAMLFTQIMRVYHRCFGVRTFFVDPFQFGADNQEGLSSGAFWFYYRLGFRPDDVGLRETARAEWRRISSNRRHRSSIRMLRTLAAKRLVLKLPGARRGDTPDQIRIGLAVTAKAGEEFGGDRDAARRHAVKRVSRLISSAHLESRSRDVRDGFCSLSVAIDIIDDLESWPAAQRRQLREVLLTRGGERELTYQHALRRCARLRRAWLRVDQAIMRRLRAAQSPR